MAKRGGEGAFRSGEKRVLCEGGMRGGEARANSLARKKKMIDFGAKRVWGKEEKEIPKWGKYQTVDKRPSCPAKKERGGGKKHVTGLLRGGTKVQHIRRGGGGGRRGNRSVGNDREENEDKEKGGGGGGGGGGKKGGSEPE